MPLYSKLLPLMRLGFQELTSDLKTESRIIPIAERIGIGLIHRCLRRIRFQYLVLIPRLLAAGYFICFQMVQSII